MMSTILTIWRKEVQDALRDRRMIMGVLGFSVMGPIMFVAMMFYAANTAEEAESKDPNLVVVGLPDTSSLVTFLKGQDITIIDPSEATIASSIKDPSTVIGDADALLVADDDYAERFKAGRMAILQLYVDRSKRDKRRAATEIGTKINAYNLQVGQSRLLAMGIPPASVRPIKVDIADTSSANRRVQSFAFYALYIFVFGTFVSSLSIAVDTSAGERERKSLQTLLVQPVSPLEIIMGKWMIAVTFGMSGMVISIIGTMTGLMFAPLDVVGIPLHLNLSSQLLMLSLFLPLCLLTSSVQILVSFLAKTFKEAMQYQQMVMMFPVIGAVLVFAFNDFHVEGTLTYVPILSQLQMGQSVLISGSYPTGLFALSVSIIVGLAAVVLIVASKRLGSEKILTAS